MGSVSLPVARQEKGASGRDHHTRRPNIHVNVEEELIMWAVLTVSAGDFGRGAVDVANAATRAYQDFECFQVAEIHFDILV